MEFDKNAIQELLKVAKRMDEKNLVNTFEGNISVKKDGLIYITPTATNKGLLTEEMVAVIDGNGKQIAGNCKHTSELPMHLLTYKIRDDIGGVVHCHAPYLTAHALCGIPVTSESYPEMLGVFGTIDVAAYGRPGTDAIIEAAVPILKKKKIVLLGNHGAISVGKTVTEAMNTMEAAEAITKVLFLANRLGKPVPLPKEDYDHFMSLS